MNTRAAFLVLSVILSGAAIAALPAQAQLFGESDEVKAARQAHEDSQDSQITQLDGRVKLLENQVGNLTESLANATGSNEELSHQIQDLRQKMNAEQKDFSYRLCMLSAQQLGAGGGQGLNCGAGGVAGTASAAPPAGSMAPGTPLPPIGGQTAAPQAPSPASEAPQQLGNPPGTLGTLPADAVPSAAPSQPSAPPGQGQFERAMAMLGNAQYAEASAAFRSYADANPSDGDLSAQAIYWIGDIAYVQHDYPTAARAFAEQIKKYPDSSRSPDSMLKLGQSLLAEGQTRGGCTTLAEVKIRYPKAPAATLTAADGAHKAACR
ncbi:MAG: tol-pal system protein YbgF [Rhizomicrobium sp.]